MSYRIEFKRSVKKDIQPLPQSVLARLREAIEALSLDPHPPGSQMIRGYQDYFRIRLGTYRVIYQVDDVVRIICIIKIGHRKDVYRKLSH